MALTLSAACSRSDSGDDSVLGYRLPPSETHFTFTFAGTPAKGVRAGRPAVTFRVPREYVRFQGVLSRKNGQVYQVPLQIELPGATPWQERPWLKRGTPEFDEFMRTWIGRFIVEISVGSGVGARTYFLNSIDPNDPHRRKGMVQDGEAYGLVRYSPIRCYTPKDLEQPHLRQFLEAKPVDDPMPQANCRVDRRGAEHFSPLAVTDPDEVVTISCLQSSCRATFGFDGLGANVDFRDDKLVHWVDIVDPIRDLVRSFVVRDTMPSARVSAATKSSR